MPPPSRNPPARPRTATGQAAAARPRRTGVAPAVRPAAKLVCSAGPASGEEFPLSGDEVTIGRAADATVSVPDTSVSRKHALVRKTDAGWAVSDLGSGNGTIVNGEVISEEQLLSNDDVITLGDSEFQFVDPGAGAGSDALAPTPRRAPVRTSRTGGGSTSRPRTSRAARLDEDPAVAAKKKRKLFIVAGTTLAVVMALGVGFKAISNKKEAEARAKAAVVKQKRDELLAEFQSAKTLIKDARFDEARQSLEAILGADEEAQVLRPDEKKSIGTYLETANREVPNEQGLQEAGKALAADQLGQAAAVLGKIKTSIPSTEKRLDTLKSTLETRLGEKVVEARKKLSSAPRDLATQEQVKAMAEDIMAARPEDRDAPDIKKQAEDNIARIKNPNLPPPIPETPHLEVMNRFRNGDQSGAVSLA
jgi:pSer/pThr/pTyr-binding forkhead associated (FHA) protein